MSTEKVTVEKCENSDQLKLCYQPAFVQDHAYVEGCYLPEKYVKFADAILDFEVKPDDVFVVSFPKCGTTWTQEMVWCIVNDLDFETAKKKYIQERFPFLEFSALSIFPELLAGVTTPPEYVTDTLGFARNLQGRRCIKSHLPLRLLPRQIQTHARQAKVVYVARDPRDACVSYFHHQKLLHGFTGDLDTFVKLFVKGEVAWGSFWEHVLEFWKIRDSPNLLFLTYEEMKRDLGAVIARVATFLGKSLAPHQLQQLRHHLSFDSMKNNPSVNYENMAAQVKHLRKTNEEDEGTSPQFMRSGKSGAYVESLTHEQIELMESWTRVNIEGTDYVLPESKYIK